MVVEPMMMMMMNYNSILGQISAEERKEVHLSLTIFKEIIKGIPFHRIPQKIMPGRHNTQPAEPAVIRSVTTLLAVLVEVRVGIQTVHEPGQSINAILGTSKRPTSRSSRRCCEWGVPLKA